MTVTFPVGCGIVAMVALLISAGFVTWKGKNPLQKRAIPALLAVSTFLACYIKIFAHPPAQGELLPTFIEFMNTAAIAFITVHLATDNKSNQ